MVWNNKESLKLVTACWGLVLKVLSTKKSLIKAEFQIRSKIFVWLTIQLTTSRCHSDKSISLSKQKTLFKLSSILLWQLHSNLIQVFESKLLFFFYIYRTYSKMVDYLFYVWQDHNENLHQIIEKGFEEVRSFLKL